jgi:4a-hydroxytetrahydrobiopterin dehydratase
MGASTVGAMLKEVPGWELNETGTEISRTFSFKNFHQTMAFVNALAWIAHREDHHPELEVGYKRCRVRYSTHAIGGLSENDFICAAKVAALVDGD